MGELKDLAKKSSNWFKIEIGESAVVKYLGYKVVPSNLDPTKDVVQYKLLEDGREKYWTNSSGRNMAIFDGLAQGKDWVKISREQSIDKAGKVEANKSKWVVEKAEEPKEQPTPEKAWDEV